MNSIIKGQANPAPTYGRGQLALFTAILVLAMALTFSCSSGNDDGGSSSSSGGGASCGKLMSQNLNVDAAGSVCYDNDPVNCSKYGRLYDWATAMKLPAKCNETLSTEDPDCAIQSKHKGICPSGQHIPSIEELSEYGSGCLKNQLGGSGNSGGYFRNAGSDGRWWSASEYSGSYAYSRYMGYGSEYANWDNYYKSYLYSVRCVQD
ncbi:MAG: hypothetical protein LBH25_01700 [Fibromonadaceae bacterium]|jgi:hypothetical protein|nr:hypothetical protein [Fibromonadaceae bacterium]